MHRVQGVHRTAPGHLQNPRALREWAGAPQGIRTSHGPQFVKRRWYNGAAIGKLAKWRVLQARQPMDPDTTSDSLSEASGRLLGPAALLGFFAFAYLAWPISPVLIAAVAGWWYSRTRADPWARASASLLGSAAIGLGILSAALFVVNLNLLLFSFDLVSFIISPQWILKIESFARATRDLLERWHGLGVWTFPAAMATLIVLSRLVPRFNLIRRLISLRKLVSGGLVALMVLTSFTFFGHSSFDGVAADAILEVKTQLRPTWETDAKDLAAETLRIAVQHLDAADHDFFHQMFRELDKSLNQEFPVRSLLRDGASENQVREERTRQLIADIEKTVDAATSSRVFTRDGTPKADLREDLVSEVPSTVDKEIEDFSKRGAQRERQLIEQIAQEHSLRVLERGILGTPTGESQPANPGNRIRADTKGIRWIANELVSGAVPGFGEGILPLVEIFVEKLIQNYAEPILDRIARTIVERPSGSIDRQRQSLRIGASIRPALLDPGNATRFLSLDAWYRPVVGDTVVSDKDRTSAAMELVKTKLNELRSDNSRVFLMERLYSERIDRVIRKGRPGLRRGR